MSYVDSEQHFCESRICEVEDSDSFNRIRYVPMVVTTVEEKNKDCPKLQFGPPLTLREATTPRLLAFTTSSRSDSKSSSLKKNHHINTIITIPQHTSKCGERLAHKFVMCSITVSNYYWNSWIKITCIYSTVLFILMTIRGHKLLWNFFKLTKLLHC